MGWTLAGISFWSRKNASANAADLHENYISRLETGEQESGLFVILRLCRAVEIAPGALLEMFCA